MSEIALWRRWVVVVTVAEATGFGVVAVVAAYVDPWLLPAAGLLDGAALGAGQVLVWRAWLPRLDARAYVGATAAAAGVAWAIGLLPSATYDVWSAWPVALAMGVGVVLGLGLLLSIGLAQWLVLRAVVPRAGGWVGWTALAWLAGLGAFFALTSPLWHPGQPASQVIGIGAAGGVVMAAVMAAVTGWGACRVVGPRPV